MKIPNPNHVKKLMNIINTSDYPSHVSFRITDIGTNFSVFELDVEQKHMQPFSVVHGGVFAVLVDSAAFWSVYFGIEDEDSGLTSIDLKINYLSAAYVGKKLITRGKQIKLGKTIGYAEAQIEDENGTILAHGTSSLMVLPGKGLTKYFSLPPKFING